MNPTPYTDDQILEAIEQALGSLNSRDMITVRPGDKWRSYWDSEKAVRLQIGKKFLELLSKPQPEQDPYATLKAYAKAGARIRFEDEFGWGEWKAMVPWNWTLPPENYQVHPADLHLLDVKSWTPKPGDVVQLKSGGPRMTMICASTHEGAYKCTWFANDGTLHTAHIDLACLQQA